MHKRRNLKGRQTIRRASLLRCILQHIATPSFVISLLIPPALTVSGCGRTGIENDRDGIQEDPASEQSTADSALFSISVSTDDRVTGHEGKIGRLDIFIYDSDGLQELEKHITLSPETISPNGISTLGAVCLPGTKTVVGIANMPHEADENKVKRFNAIELLTARFGDDDPRFPIMSGTCQVSENGTGTLVLKPLMSAIVISSITNSMERYRMVEEPELILVSPSFEAEILRESGFRPDSQETDSSSVRLSCDIGTFTQYPSARLFCYPNDDPGQTPTLCILRCTIDSTDVQYSMEMPRIKRNSAIDISLEISGTDSISFICH